MNLATIDETLRELGSAPVVDPDLDQLEARLLAGIRTADAPPAPVAAPAGRHRRRTVPLVVGAIAAGLLALAVLAAGWFTTGDDPYVLAAADDVEVVLPDGEVVAGTPGLELPVGSVLDVGGSMEIGGTAYGPGEYVITVDGPVVADRSGGGEGPPGAPGDGDRGDGVVVTTSTTVAPLPADPPAGGAPASTRPVRPDRTTTTTTAPPDRPTTVPAEPAVTDRPTTTAPPDRPTTTSSADRPSTTVRPDRTTTTTTGPTRDRPHETTTGPPRDRP